MIWLNKKENYVLKLQILPVLQIILTDIMTYMTYIVFWHTPYVFMTMYVSKTKDIWYMRRSEISRNSSDKRVKKIAPIETNYDDNTWKVFKSIENLLKFTKNHRASAVFSLFLYYTYGEYVIDFRMFCCLSISSSFMTIFYHSQKQKPYKSSLLTIQIPQADNMCILLYTPSEIYR